MKNYFLISLICLLTILFQESFMLEFFGAEINPNFVVGFSFAFLLLNREKEALFTAFIGGLIFDLTSVGIVGLSSLILVLAIYLSIIIRKNIFKGVFVQVLLIILTTALYKTFFGYPDIPDNLRLLWAGLLNAIISVLVYLFIRSFSHRFKSDEYRIKA